jgi:hypothetical protein
LHARAHYYFYIVIIITIPGKKENLEENGSPLPLPIFFLNYLLSNETRNKRRNVLGLFCRWYNLIIPVVLFPPGIIPRRWFLIWFVKLARPYMDYISGSVHLTYIHSTFEKWFFLIFIWTFEFQSKLTNYNF